MLKVLFEPAAPGPGRGGHGPDREQWAPGPGVATVYTPWAAGKKVELTQ